MIILIRSAVLALIALLAMPAGAAESISPEAMAEKLKQSNVQLLDVRTQAEFAEGHLPGATLIPHDELADRLVELGTPGEIYVYCRSGRRAGLAAEVLSAAGWRVHEIEGSYLAWQAAGLPVERPADQPSKQEKAQ